MEDGGFRCDVNVTVSHDGKRLKSDRCEVKNVNSFKSVANSISFFSSILFYAFLLSTPHTHPICLYLSSVHESKRHVELLERGEKVPRQTMSTRTPPTTRP